MNSYYTCKKAEKHKFGLIEKEPDFIIEAGSFKFLVSTIVYKNTKK